MEVDTSRFKMGLAFLCFCLEGFDNLAFFTDDNEFEDVNIVRPNDFYQSRDADAGNW